MSAAILAPCAAVVLAVAPGATSPAYASCAREAGPQGSPVAFVGTAGPTTRGVTELRVRLVRHGPDLAPTVWVRTGTDSGWLGGTSSSVDAQLEEGGSYAVGAYREDGELRATACTIAPASDLRATPRPRAATAGGLTGEEPGRTWPVPLAGVVLGAGGLVALRSAARRRDRART